MKVRLLIILIFSSASVLAQETSPWQRVYTFDDSHLDMNTHLVTVAGENFARVRFRWTFDQPEALGSGLKGTYKSKLEIIEFNCKDRLYRLHHVSLFDSSGRLIHAELIKAPKHWRPVTYGIVMEKLFAPACALVEGKTRPPRLTREPIEIEKVLNFAALFLQHLETTKDFQPLIKEFFAPDYLTRYLDDPKKNWFANVERSVAVNAGRTDLQRFYLALMNSSYLSALHFVSQHRYVAKGLVHEEQIVPPDVIEFIDTHPYTEAYRGKHENYEYLAERIDSIERLRSYTTLLEGIAERMRSRITNMGPDFSGERALTKKGWGGIQHKVETCSGPCLGLPQGTRLFQVELPLLRLQVVEVKGELQVISATVGSN